MLAENNAVSWCYDVKVLSQESYYTGLKYLIYLNLENSSYSGILSWWCPFSFFGLPLLRNENRFSDILSMVSIKHTSVFSVINPTKLIEYQNISFYLFITSVYLYLYTSFYSMSYILDYTYQFIRYLNIMTIWKENISSIFNYLCYKSFRKAKIST